MAPRLPAFRIVERITLGTCDPPGDSPRVIEIDPRQGQRERLGTLIHEALHLADWDMLHEQIERLAPVIAAVLWRDGWRRERRRKQLAKSAKSIKQLRS